MNDEYILNPKNPEVPPKDLKKDVKKRNKLIRVFALFSHRDDGEEESTQ